MIGSRRQVLCALLLVGFGLARAAEPEKSGAVRGKLFLKGKTFTYSYAWLVRGPDTFDKTRPSAYLILSSDDLSSAITACKDVSCVISDAVKEGAVIQPADDAAHSFWLRVVSRRLDKEQQLSARTWESSIDSHDRLAGTLRFSFSNTKDEADLEIDARLIKEFPVATRR